MSMVELDFDDEGLRQIVMDLAATEIQLKKALGSTLRKMARWMKTQSARGLSRELDIQQKIIRRRLKDFNVRGRGDQFSVKVWYGLDPISFIHLKPRENRRGVKSRNREIEGGFIAKKQVFKRVGKSRLPIEKQTVEIADDAQTYIEDNVIGSDEFEREFFKIFERELKWQTRKS